MLRPKEVLVITLPHSSLPPAYYLCIYFTFFQSLYQILSSSFLHNIVPRGFEGTNQVFRLTFILSILLCWKWNIRCTKIERQRGSRDCVKLGYTVQLEKVGSWWRGYNKTGRTAIHRSWQTSGTIRQQGIRDGLKKEAITALGCSRCGEAAYCVIKDGCKRIFRTMHEWCWIWKRWDRTHPWTKQSLDWG